MSDDRSVDQMAVRCENIFKTAFNAVPTEVGLIIYNVIRDESGEITDWIIRDTNEKTLRDFGLPKDQFLNQRATQIYRENPNLMSLIELSNQVMKTGEACRFEMNLPFNGKRLLMAFFRYDENTLVHTAVDLTEQRLAEEALQTSENQLMLALDAAQMGTWDWKIDQGYIDCSDRCRSFFAFDPEITIDYLMFINAVHPDDRERIDQTIKEALERHGDYDVEMRVLLPDGTVRWVASKGHGFYHASGEPVRMAGIAIDITENKRVEESLRIANERLMEADRQKDDFLATLSHELRNPLASIRNSLYIMENIVPREEQSRRAVEIIDRQVNHLCRLVDDLLDVTRIQKNRIQLKLQQVELNDLISQTVEDYRSHFELNDLRLRFIPSSASLYVHADRTRLAQVVGNLLLNAAKFTDHGGEVCLSIECDLPKQQAVVYVGDTGIGMTPETLERLFIPFVQANSTLDRNQGGLGLGLALVKGIVELHAGKVSAFSEGLGKGSVFTIWLPLSSPVMEEDAKSTNVPNRQRKILIIDDNVDVANSLFELIQFLGCEAAVAFDGREGLAKAKDFNPDILLCDIGLPEMDGYAVANAFRMDEVLKSTYLVALTGYALPEDIRRAKKAGFDHHVAKPPELSELQRVLSQGNSRDNLPAD